MHYIVLIHSFAIGQLAWSLNGFMREELYYSYIIDKKLRLEGFSKLD